MCGRDSELESTPSAYSAPVVLRWPANWTAVFCFGGLGLLHLSMVAASIWSGRGEYHMSVVFGAMFVTVAAGFAVVRRRVVLRPGDREIQVITGAGRAAYRREISFAQVRYVRVTLLNAAGRHESTVTIICQLEEIEAPPHSAPRQLALLLAMTLGVRLVKIYGDEVASEPAARIGKLMGSDQENVV